ncbi:MAG: Hsp70 family protein, partial [Myxococcaceae bacterium]
PTAAALYYANLRSPEQTVLVFDLGGGTLDVTLLSVQNRVVKVLATGGDAFLGGANFDERVVELLVDDFEQKNGVRIRDNKVVMQRLVFGAESAKIILSSKESTRLRVPCITQKDGQFVHFDYELTRKQFEGMVAPLIERSVGAVDEVLQRAGLKHNQVDELVMVGGQTRMPAIRNRFHEFRRSTNEKDVHPDLGVAIGAAILGRNLQRSAGTGLSDVVPMPIGVMAPGVGSVEVISANTPVPAARTISLDKLPPEGPVSMALFESVDRTSVDRELLGTVSIPPEWRNANRGPASLELRMGQDFVLSAAVVSEKGARLVLPIANR